MFRKKIYNISQSPHDLNLLLCMKWQSKVTITEQCDIHSTSFQSCGWRENIRGLFINSLTYKPGHWPGEKRADKIEKVNKVQGVMTEVVVLKWKLVSCLQIHYTARLERTRRNFDTNQGELRERIRARDWLKAVKPCKVDSRMPLFHSLETHGSQNKVSGFTIH